MSFLRLYVDDYNCNKSCLGTCFSRLVPPDYTAAVYVSPRDWAWDPFSLANLVPKLSLDVCLGKGSDGTLTTLRYSFYLFSAASWEVYKVLPKLVRGVLFLPASDVYVRSFLCPVTLSKTLHTKLWVTIFGSRVKSSLSETTNLVVPFTVSYYLHKQIVN